MILNFEPRIRVKSDDELSEANLEFHLVKSVFNKCLVIKKNSIFEILLKASAEIINYCERVHR